MMKTRHDEKELRTQIIDYVTLDEQCIVEGRAVTFNDKTLLFTVGDDDYYEQIESTAFNGVDFGNVYLYYNHEPKAYAGTKNKTLELEIRDDGLYFRAYLNGTTAAKDLYNNIKSGLIDKCSFGFTIKDEVFDEKTNTFIVKQIDKLLEISVVDFPAYENTSVHARSEVTRIESERQAQITNQRKHNIIIKTLF